MKNNFSAALVGFIFALGLGYSGMTQPQKVIGFLDIFGNWDPSLIFVMIGAIAVHALFYQVILKKPRPLFADKWQVPQKFQITPPLVIGGVLFGIGWGIAGYCPGPAVTSLADLNFSVFVFVLSMVAGMLLFKLLDTKFKFNR